MVGTLYGGSSPFNITSKETDGPTAIAFNFDTLNSFTDLNAVLMAISNDGISKVSIYSDGTLDTVGDIYTKSLTSDTDITANNDIISARDIIAGRNFAFDYGRFVERYRDYGSLDLLYGFEIVIDEPNAVPSSAFRISKGDFHSTFGYLSTLPKELLILTEADLSSYSDFNVGVAGVRAIGTMTFTDVPVVGQTFMLDGQGVTLVAGPTIGLDEVEIGTDAAEQGNYVARDFNAHATKNNTAFAVSDGAGNVKFISVESGVAGNAISFTESMSNCTVDGGGFLGGTVLGVDPINNFTVDKSTGDTHIKGNLTVDGVTSELSIISVPPSAGDAGIQAAINTLSAAGGGIVQLLEGIYVIDTGIKPTAGTNNVIIQGVGAGTILQHDGVYVGECFNIQGISVQSAAINNVTAGDLSVTYTTASDAGNILAGDRLYIEGTDAWTETDYQYSIAAADGNPGTGIVTLSSPLQRTLTSVTSRNLRGGENCIVRDLRLTTISPLGTANGLRMDYTYNGVIRGVKLDYWDGSNMQSAIRMDNYGINNLVENCSIRNIQYAGGIMIRTQIGTVIRDNFITDVNRPLGTDLGGITVEASNADCEISRNDIRSSGSVGIECKNIVSRRTSFLENYVCKASNSGMLIRSESEVLGNTIEDCPGTNGISLQFGKKIIVKGNFIKGCAAGLETWATNQYCVISGNYIENCTSMGIITAIGSHDNIISDNMIHNVGYMGIWCQGNNTIISNNRVDNVSVYQRGIQSDGIGCVLSGNIVTNAAGGGIIITGTDTIVTGNNCKGLGISLWTSAGNIVGINKE